MPLHAPGYCAGTRSSSLARQVAPARWHGQKRRRPARRSRSHESPHPHPGIANRRARALSTRCAPRTSQLAAGAGGATPTPQPAAIVVKTSGWDLARAQRTVDVSRIRPLEAAWRSSVLRKACSWRQHPSIGLTIGSARPAGGALCLARLGTSDETPDPHRGSDPQPGGRDPIARPARATRMGTPPAPFPVYGVNGSAARHRDRSVRRCATRRFGSWHCPCRSATVHFSHATQHQSESRLPLQGRAGSRRRTARCSLTFSTRC